MQIEDLVMELSKAKAAAAAASPEGKAMQVVITTLDGEYEIGHVEFQPDGRGGLQISIQSLESDRSRWMEGGY